MKFSSYSKVFENILEFASFLFFLSLSSLKHFQSYCFNTYQLFTKYFQYLVLLLFSVFFGYWIAAYIVHNLWLIFSYLSFSFLCFVQFVRSLLLSTKWNYFKYYFAHEISLIIFGFFCILVLIFEVQS